MNRIQVREFRTAGAMLFSVLGLLAAATPAAAGSTERMGTNAAPELLIPIGPRSDALGGNTVSDVSGAEAIYWNPAGLASTNKTEILFSHLTHIGDNDVNYLGVATKAGSFGTLGFSA